MDNFAPEHQSLLLKGSVSLFIPIILMIERLKGELAFDFMLSGADANVHNAPIPEKKSASEK